MKNAKHQPEPIVAEVAAAMKGLLTKAKVIRMPERRGLRKPARITELDIEITFEGFKTFREKPLVDALDAAKEFCMDMASADKPARWLTLLGRSGTGKTDLAKRITGFFNRELDFLRDERSEGNEQWHRHGGFKEWINVISEMQSGDFSGLYQLKRDWFVSLDDIGTERAGTDFAITKLYEVLVAREHLFTVITANLPIDKISEKMDTRIASRLLRNNSLLVDVDVVDFNRR